LRQNSAPEFLADLSRQCNGSDVFCSDICTCRPYLIFGIEEAVKEAQNGGSGVVIYFRKEGRALGEVTKVSFFSGPSTGLLQELTQT
jgi:GTP cyclohydrolase II